MFVRKAFTGAVTVAVAGSVLVLSPGAAHAAEPDDTTFTPVAADIIGVGSDTSQNALFRLATSYNASAPTARLATYAATGGGTIALPSGAVTRPNGSGNGKATLFNPSNPDVDFARSSSTLSTDEANAGLQQFPFALDTLKMAVSNQVPSHAPASLTATQIVSIYKGDVTNWNQVGGTAGVIAPKIPQGGSGTRSFFEAQLKAANGNVAVVLAATVQEVQEHDPAPIRGNADAVAPFSAGRAGLAGTSLRLTNGFSADRALYNVVRGADLGKAPIQALFGVNGFLCSDGANDEIEAAGFEQLARVADGGVCGQSTTSASTNFAINAEAGPVATTTTLSGASTAPRALRLTARVSGSPTPTGTVRFATSAGAVLGTANLIGGTATLIVGNRLPGSYAITAQYSPNVNTSFVASTDGATVKVKAGSSVKESFPASVAKAKRSARGVVTVAFIGTTAKPTGKVVLKEGRKTVGTGTLRAGKATITLKKSKLGAGKSTVKIAYAGDATGFGSSKAFTITFKR